MAKTLLHFSPGDAINWELHRYESDLVARFYSGSKIPQHQRIFRQMSCCSSRISFYLDKEGDYKLYASNFCKQRSCPVCQWRRVILWRRRMRLAIPKVEAQLPGWRWLFLTLTVENIPLVQLRGFISSMQDSFSRLTRYGHHWARQQKPFPAVGWIKSLEVTRAANNFAHPHYHCLLLVDPQYFDKSQNNFLSHEDWLCMWQRSLSCDYRPSIRISAIKEDKSGTSKLSEAAKYTVKVSDLVADSEWLLEYSNQIHRVRAVEVGGIFRNNPDFQVEQNNDNDLIGRRNRDVDADDQVYFQWDGARRRYVNL